MRVSAVSKNVTILFLNVPFVEFIKHDIIKHLIIRQGQIQLEIV